MASSSAQEPQHHQVHHHPYGATAAPPPTPSTHSTDTPTPDVLSNILHRLPPTLSLSLSLPTRRSIPTPPLISLSDPHPALLTASTNLGFFHLTHPHPLPPSASSTALSLFNLPHSEKQLLFPNNWPLGYDDHDDDVSSFCIDPSSCSRLELDSLCKFGREMEKLGLKVVEELAYAVGFKNPGPDQMCSLLWISDGTNEPGRVYPYVVGLHFQVSCGNKNKYSVLTDSGWVNVSERVDSVLVTVGDICQVWSNGKLKKVRGRPVPNTGDDNNMNKSQRCITMSLLITLPVESTVSPLLSDLAIDGADEQEIEESGDPSTIDGAIEQMQFRSFSFEDYAWRVYHERLLLKDTLVRYRV